MGRCGLRGCLPSGEDTLNLPLSVDADTSFTNGEGIVPLAYVWLDLLVTLTDVVTRIHPHN